MSKSLYRKYRSRSLDEIVGQKGVVKALKSAITKNSLSHAYLFTGPRGVGKTSIARILAFEINKLAYDPDNLPVDIIEIDAASNRGIDEIRELRNKARIAPVSAPYKVYIIDEVHMLTTPAFNALLKTLEEPPAHVIFILATTESHKLPETIISRTQRYNFSLATTKEVKDHLEYISKQENIIIEDEALKLIAIHSGGSLRDALSTLDHVRHLSESITAEDVRINIGLPSDEIVQGIIEAIASNDASRVLEQTNIAEQDNVAAVSLAHHILHHLKRQIQSQDKSLSLNQTTKLMKALSRIESSSKPEVQLTVALLEAIEDDQIANKAVTIKQRIPVAKQQANPKPTIVTEKPANEIDKDTGNISKEKTETTKNSTVNFSIDTWNELLEDVRATHNTIYSVLRMAEINLEHLGKQQIHIDFKFPFHQKRISDSKNIQVINEKLEQRGYNFEIICGISDKPSRIEQPAIKTDESKKDNELSRIRGVFGGAEVME